MELHPDRNPNRNTTSAFQALQQAYEILSDQRLRQKYDADSSVPNPQPTGDAGKTTPLSPIRSQGVRRFLLNRDTRSSIPYTATSWVRRRNPIKAFSSRAAKHGYKIADPLGQLKATLQSFVASLPPQQSFLTLRKKHDIQNERLGYQVALIAVFLTAIAGYLYQNELATREVEQARLESEGFARARAAAIAAQEAETLRALEKPMPENGIYSIIDPNSYDSERSPPFKVTNAPGTNTLMKLIRANDGAEVMSLFVRAGQTIEVGVPPGSYRVKIASGTTWYGDSIRFGPKTSYATLDSSFEFTVEGNQRLGHEVTLSRVTNGNLGELPLSASEFGNCRPTKFDFFKIVVRTSYI